MRKQKIYLETTLFNYYFDTDKDAHTATVQLFKEIGAGKYQAFTSGMVVEELLQAPSEKSDKMMALVDEYDVTNLQVTEEVRRLADIYITEGIIPQKYKTDSIHIAVATVNGLDAIVSMNFKHIVKPKTVQMTRVVNALNGYRPIEIMSPKEVVENEKN